MADSKILAPFILKWEGNYVNDPIDMGGETNKGITYNTWKQVFGNTHDRFMSMAADDWETIFKKGFWDKCEGDLIDDQLVANAFVDWFWGSGNYAIKGLQKIVGVTVDGIIGEQSISAINAYDCDLFGAIIDARLQFYHDIVAANPAQGRFLQGWENRVNNLKTYFI
jgi:lysozyme family protein